MKITVKKVSGGYAVYKNDIRWTLPSSRIEAENAAKFMRESKFGKK